MLNLKRFARCCASSVLLLIPAANIWAVPLSGTAYLCAQSPVAAKASVGSGKANAVTVAKRKNSAVAGLPRVVRFREEEGRGLLVSAWVNGAGPFTFAIDTGAGATILSRRVADQAQVSVNDKRPMMIGGLSGTGAVASYEAIVRSLA
jgi:hypothetical protein